MRGALLAVSAALLAGVSMPAGGQVTIYDNDFATAVNPPGSLGTWSLGALYNRDGNNSLGMGNVGFRITESPTLNFAGLPAFSGGNVSFRILLWDSWDPGPPHCCGPDQVGFRINGGAPLFMSDFGPTAGGGRFFDLAFAIPAGAGTLALEWLGSTTQHDESWSIDDVEVQIAPITRGQVPEPSTYALLGGGLAALGAVSARRRRRAE